MSGVTIVEDGEVLVSQQALWGRVAVDGTVHVIRQDFPIGRPRRVSPGAKSLFSDGLAPARCCPPSPRAGAPIPDIRLFLPVVVSPPQKRLPARNPGSVGDNPRGSFLYGKAISGNPPPPVKSRASIQIEMGPLIKPVDLGFCH